MINLENIEEDNQDKLNINHFTKEANSKDIEVINNQNLFHFAKTLISSALKDEGGKKSTQEIEDQEEEEIEEKTQMPSSKSKKFYFYVDEQNAYPKTNISISIVNANNNISNNNSNNNTNVNITNANKITKDFTFHGMGQDNRETQRSNKNNLIENSEKKEIDENSKLLNNFFSDLNLEHVKQAQNSKNELGLLLGIKNFISHLQRHPLTTFTKKAGNISGFCAFSYKNYRNINEDKLGIHINFNRENHLINFYGIFDGHEGTGTSEKLKAWAHQEILNAPTLFSEFNQAVFSGLNAIEDKLKNDFLDKMRNEKVNNYVKFDLSGSCALMLITIDDMFHMINLGDSKAILSCEGGKKIYSLSTDHSVGNLLERRRIFEFGGEIKPRGEKDKTLARIFPGSTPVGRSIGDIQAKLLQCGGKPGVISSTPDILSFKYKSNFDFIVMGSGSIFDKLSNKQIGELVFDAIKQAIIKRLTFEEALEKVVVNLMREAILQGTKDNISIIFLCFDNLKELYETRNIIQASDIINSISSSPSEFNNLYDDLADRFLLNKQIVKLATRQKTGMDLRNKSILNSNNIHIDNSQLSFQKSDVTLEAKRKTSPSEKDKKGKKKVPLCCGLFV